MSSMTRKPREGTISLHPLRPRRSLLPSRRRRRVPHRPSSEGRIMRKVQEKEEGLRTAEKHFDISIPIGIRWGLSVAMQNSLDGRAQTRSEEECTKRGLFKTFIRASTCVYLTVPFCCVFVDSPVSRRRQSRWFLRRSSPSYFVLRSTPLNTSPFLVVFLLQCQPASPTGGGKHYNRSVFLHRDRDRFFFATKTKTRNKTHAHIIHIISYHIHMIHATGYPAARPSMRNNQPACPPAHSAAMSFDIICMICHDAIYTKTIPPHKFIRKPET